MSKRAITPLAAALKLVDQLSDGERQTLFDYLRPERKERPKSSSPAQGAGRRSSSKKQSAQLPDQNTVGDLVNVSSAAASGGD